jgi:short-subunit dehydrogenase
MQEQMQNAVVVITGASSGIGRATALAFAAGQARLVLAARNEQSLEEVAEMCRRCGTEALVVPTDVRNEQAVVRLAGRTIAQFGRIDVWINNAGVTLYTPFLAAPEGVYRQVIETNLFGCINGVQAVLPIFRTQGHGTLINVSSVAATVTETYAGAYSISKSGIRALGTSLRQELLLEGADRIHVCTVMPATVDTPIFQHAANYTGRTVRALPPVITAEQVASAIVRLTHTPKPEVYVGNAGRGIHLLATLAPRFAERIMARYVDRLHFYNNQPAEPTEGNVLQSMPYWNRVSGGWNTGQIRKGGTLLTAAVLTSVAIGWAWMRKHGTASATEAMPTHPTYA